MKHLAVAIGILLLVSGLAAVTVINIEEDSFGRRYPVIVPWQWSSLEPIPSDRQKSSYPTDQELANMTQSDRDLLFRVNDQINQEAASKIPSSGIHPYDGVKVSVSQGLVTLKGTVPSLFYKNRSESLARQVNGVRGVQNELVILQ